ncbi:MAG: RdgB/HAM1 family non-canonical purine NTP pyrophosphatase [Ruminococcaceae bacterium]|nr:RdgB/HAM1 family non-canonical purine NTP pyrophosphatase [Oscillospiraceae bacterium]
MTDFLIATNNSHKVEEFKRILNPLGINVLSAKEAGVDLGEVLENGTNFAENANIKALSAYKISSMPTIADDSGLCVDALGGAPGLYTARYGGEGLTQTERNALLLKNLESVTKENRTARFVCSICCIIDEDNVIEVEGICEGYIANSPSGTDGFGYDPVFLYKDGRCFGQIIGEEKDIVSHRGVALRKLKEALEIRKDVL